VYDEASRRFGRQGVIMKFETACLTLGLAFVLPLGAAHAQSPDAQYCQSLADRYTTYVNDPNSRNPAPANARVQAAISQCQSGNTAAGIPVLEKTLTNAGFTLPARG
jgi:hypothetical protein